MLDISSIRNLAEEHDLPVEDLLFIALNVNGAAFDCQYNRMRMGLHVTNDTVCNYAACHSDRDFYFALPVQDGSPFRISDGVLRLHDTVIGDALEPTEDICDSHYMRRKGTSLNINPNSRTSCRGCHFCYTNYQVPFDRKRIWDEADLREFFEQWMRTYGLTNLSHLIQVSIVTGCYATGDDVGTFLHRLRSVAEEYQFTGRIFYLGSQLRTAEAMKRLTDIAPFGICFSLETFERRQLLREDKRALSLPTACEVMQCALDCGYEVNFSYIVGMEPLMAVERHFRHLRAYVNKFPTINVLQLHKFHPQELMCPDARELVYFIRARKLIESLFVGTDMRPLVWEDYRSLWYLRFADEPLAGIRFPW